MSKEQSNVKGRLVLITILPLVAFIILKLTGVIAWSWLWVLSPLWIMAAIVDVYMVLLTMSEL